ncbi:hypothetical protein FQA39_LY06452 [Lamprigera yunnana]|nr:hypothetical protein FQA39_LY06452 [Lamprigera yunnana]
MPISIWKKLLLKYPEIFTIGYVSHKQPNEETMAITNLNMFFYGKGWSEEFENIQDQTTIPPNKSILAKIGMATTCSCRKNLPLLDLGLHFRFSRTQREFEEANRRGIDYFKELSGVPTRMSKKKVCPNC